MYNGEFLLRFDDTDPKVKKPVEGAEAIFREDLKWLGYTPDKVFFASDRLDTYYEYMRKAIKAGKAYVCLCRPEEWRDKTKAGKACSCREEKPREQLERFGKMLKNEIKEGEGVLRIKTDLNHRDPSVRDWWAAKCVDSPLHPNPKAGGKHVWPSYNFASAIDDHDFSITLIIRGQEHEQNRTKQEFLYSYFGWKYPESIHFGRISLGDMVLSTSKIREGIENGTYSGWDDPKLGTIRALRKRGFDSRALVDAIMEVGTRHNDANISPDRLADLNKKYIDRESRRVTFMEGPVTLDVEFSPAAEAEKDGVTVKLKEGTERLYISRDDAEKLEEGRIVRLRNLYNVRIKRKDPLQLFSEYAGNAKMEPVASWIKNRREVSVRMPDSSEVTGMTEDFEAVKGMRLHLEKFGYCIVNEAAEGKVLLSFSHK
jgi:glutamyl-tRNA synthetase